MKKKPEQDRFVRKPITLPPDMDRAVQNKIEKLHPRVTSFSNYVQQLIAVDLVHDVLGSYPMIQSAERIPGGVRVKYGVKKAN